MAKMCPYCGIEADEFYQFLTGAQHNYVQQYCAVLMAALHAGKDGVYTIDMDAVAEAAGKEAGRPEFYYAEERQQNLFTCEVCGGVNDVLGTYAYCSRCGTRNDLQELRSTLRRIRGLINSGGSCESAVREAVAAFDSFATQVVGQLRVRVPLTHPRKARLQKARFHNLTPAANLLLDIFGIDILSGMNAGDVAFLTIMFHRRHVYEHRGGEADEKYIAESGDPVRLKQALRETKETAHRAIGLVGRIGAKLHEGFHDIFPPVEVPIRDYAARSARERGAKTD